MITFRKVLFKNKWSLLNRNFQAQRRLHSRVLNFLIKFCLWKKAKQENELSAWKLFILWLEFLHDVKFTCKHQYKKTFKKENFMKAFSETIKDTPTSNWVNKSVTDRGQQPKYIISWVIKTQFSFKSKVFSHVSVLKTQSTKLVFKKILRASIVFIVFEH